MVHYKAFIRPLSFSLLNSELGLILAEMSSISMRQHQNSSFLVGTSCLLWYLSNHLLTPNHQINWVPPPTLARHVGERRPGMLKTTNGLVTYPPVARYCALHEIKSVVQCTRKLSGVWCHPQTCYKEIIRSGFERIALSKHHTTRPHCKSWDIYTVLSYCIYRYPPRSLT